MRLDRLIGQLTGLSRSGIRSRIAIGDVCVDDHVERNCRHQIGPFEKVMLKGEILQNRTPRYVLLHKPAGILSATTDPEHPTVISLIDEPWANELHLAGRLDRSTSGLVILTNDSSFSESLTQPGAKVPKTYVVTLDQAVPAEVIDAFQAGIRFEKEKITTQPATVELLEPDRHRLTIFEGKHHQIKRMFAGFGIRVTALHREAIGPYHLTEELPAGQYRTFSPGDVS